MIKFLLFFTLNLPSSIYVINDTVYIAEIGEVGLPDGSIWKISCKDFIRGKRDYKRVLKGLIDPQGFVFFKNKFYVADMDRIWEVDLKGKKRLFLKPGDFEIKPSFLTDITTDGKYFYVCDKEDNKIYKISIKDKKIEVLTDKIMKPVSLFYKDGNLYVLTATFPGKIFSLKNGEIKTELISGEIKTGGRILIKGDIVFLTSSRNVRIIAFNLKEKKIKIIKENLIYPVDLFPYDGKIFYTELIKDGVGFIKIKD